MWASLLVTPTTQPVTRTRSRGFDSLPSPPYQTRSACERATSRSTRPNMYAEVDLETKGQMRSIEVDFFDTCTHESSRLCVARRRCRSVRPYHTLDGVHLDHGVVRRLVGLLCAEWLRDAPQAATRTQYFSGRNRTPWIGSSPSSVSGALPTAARRRAGARPRQARTRGAAAHPRRLDDATAAHVGRAPPMVTRRHNRVGRVRHAQLRVRPVQRACSSISSIS